MRTAERVFDQIMSEVEGQRRPGGRLGAEVSRWVDRTAPGGATDRGAGSAPGAVPVVLTGTAGSSVHAPVWVHNRTAERLADLELELTALRPGAGQQVISGSCGALSPARLDVEPGGSSMTRLSVRVPADAAPGDYDGHVLGRQPGAAPDGPHIGRLPVRVVVVP